MEHTPLFSCAYLPPVEYLSCIARSTSFILEVKEHYQKQSYRNRTCILTANGVHFLSIPVLHTSSKMMVSDIKIDYKTRWQQNHWRAIESAYSNSPYFLYYQDYLYPFYTKQVPFLIDYNLQLLDVLFRLLSIDVSYTKSENYLHDYQLDCRDLIHPKKAVKEDYPFHCAPYPQVFGDKFDFVPHLSVIDLLFNMGNDSLSYLLDSCQFSQ